MQDDQFIDKCLTLMDENATETVQSEGFKSLDASTLMKIVSRDTFNTPEINVWRACYMWAETECIRQGKTVSEFSVYCHSLLILRILAR